jgi:hypothetical protein
MNEHKKKKESLNNKRFICIIVRYRCVFFYYVKMTAARSCKMYLLKSKIKKLRIVRGIRLFDVVKVAKKTRLLVEYFREL